MALQKLFEPELNPRAMYCLRQSPEYAKMLDAGKYDPVQDTRDLIQRIKEKIADTEI